MLVGGGRERKMDWVSRGEGKGKRGKEGGWLLGL